MPVTDFLHSVLAWISVHPHWSYLIVFLVALSESLAVIGLIVPGVVMMLGAGALIATGTLDFWPVCLWAMAGAVAGDSISYWIGRRFQNQLRQIWPFSRHPETLAGGERFFVQYGGKSVAFGRFVGPVRAVIPLVAGMMGMAPGRFLAANLLSAAAWAPAYLLPGMVFGASLELAAEAAVNLVILFLALALGLWLSAWLAHRLFLLYSPRAGRWVEGLLRWADLHPRLGEVARALADPRHPAAPTLAALAGLLVLGTVVFTLIAGLVLTEASQWWLNTLTLDLMLSLHTPLADELMVGASRLADLTVLLPLGAVVYAWLWRRQARRQANYWLAALAFGLLAAPLLKEWLQVPRPDIGLVGWTSWAFPSGHTLRATVLFGFLAVFLSASLSALWRWLPYALAAVLTMAVALSRLYLGVHWLTDVLGSLALGLAWVAALGLAWRRHTQEVLSWRGLGLAAFAALAVAFPVATLVFQETDLARYRPGVPEIALSADAWRAGGWRRLPAYRQDLRARGQHPLNLQYAGALSVLTRQLAAHGWQPGMPLTADRWIRLLSPSLPLKELPVIPHVHDGHHETLTLVKPVGDNRRLVLRLWATPYRLDGRQPLWVGNVTAQSPRPVLGRLNLPSTEPDLVAPRRAAAADFGELAHPLAAAEAPLLLWSEAGR